MMDGTTKEKPIAVITLRMTARLHQALKHVAWQKRASMNELCVTTLERLVEENQHLLAEVNQGDVVKWTV